MIYAYRMLKGSKDLLEFYRDKYRYICVDEAQDTSKIQHEIIRLLAEKHKNIFMVGDEDQSIYRFRAAYPRALLDFTDTYENPYVLFLETNYRSTKTIVSAAQRFISQNMDRHAQKHMRANRGDGKPIARIHVKEKHEQYLSIAKIAKEKHGQMAVLYRNNGSAIPLMDLFLREGIPFIRLKDKGENFFTSRVVQDITYFLRFAANPNDAEAFQQIYYKCGYGFRKQTAYWSCRKAKQKGITIADELVEQMSKWPSLMQKAIEFKQLMQSIGTYAPYQAIHYIYHAWYRKYAQDHGLDIGKVELLKALAVHEDSIVHFLQRLQQLPALIQSYKCTDDEPIILSTIHSAKGLEFDAVYLVDVYDGCLPHITKEDVQDREQLKSYEEERRVFYVGITRAKNELYLLSVDDQHSSFIEEIAPQMHLDAHDRTAPSAPTSSKATAESAHADIWQYKVGAKVKHKIYGEGVIVDTKNNGNGVHLIEVCFEDGSNRNLDLKILLKNDMLHLA